MQPDTDLILLGQSMEDFDSKYADLAQVNPDEGTQCPEIPACAQLPDDESAHKVIDSLVQLRDDEERGKQSTGALLMGVGTALMMASIVLFAIEQNGDMRDNLEKLLISAAGAACFYGGFKLRFPGTHTFVLTEFVRMWDEMQTRYRIGEQYKKQRGKLGKLVDEHLFRKSTHENESTTAHQIE